MKSIISSDNSHICIQLLDENFDEFNSLKLDLGYDFLEIIESKYRITFSHFDFFLNLHYIIKQIRNYKIDIDIDLSSGTKSFIAYTMDLTKKYVEINANYRT